MKVYPLKNEEIARSGGFTHLAIVTYADIAATTAEQSFTLYTFQPGDALVQPLGLVYIKTAIVGSLVTLGGTLGTSTAALAILPASSTADFKAAAGTTYVASGNAAAQGGPEAYASGKTLLLKLTSGAAVAPTAGEFLIFFCIAQGSQNWVNLQA